MIGRRLPLEPAGAGRVDRTARRGRTVDLDLAGRTALITGASKGIGRAVATQLAAEGCNLVLVARDGEALKALSDEIGQRTGMSVQTEARDLAEANAAAELSARFPQIDILVNNAGAVPPGKLTDLSVQQIQEGWALKVFGYLGLMHAYYPAMCERGSGVIINIIGMAGERVNANVIALTGGNASLIAMTRALGAQSPEHGVRVVGVNPSMTATERAVSLWRRQAADQFGDEERWRELVAALPFGRAAEPSDIANAVAFLASPKAGYISGTVLNVDGGIGARP